jgi:hypothetical protein
MLTNIIYKARLPIIIFCIAFTNHIIFAQNLKISKEISIKNDFAYDLFALEDRVFFYRDKGQKYFFDIFDKSLNFRQSIELQFEEKKALIETLHVVDSTLNIYYTYKKEGEWYLTAVKYNSMLTPLDTVEILKTKQGFDTGHLRYIVSNDKSKIALFYMKDDLITSISLDTKSFEVLSNKNVLLNDYKARESFIEATISDQGEVFYLFEKNNESWDREKHTLRILAIAGEINSVTDIHCAESTNTGVKMSIDNKNRAIKIAGLYALKGSANNSEGYFIYSKGVGSLFTPSLDELILTPYDDQIQVDLEGVDKKVKKVELKDFAVKDIIHRADGGVILLAELAREYSRRTSSSVTSAFDRSYSPLRGYTDYYNEDIIAFSTLSDGSLDWRKILFKKQFSQDDRAIYSSYFVMKLPSRLRIVFNDEIRMSNTVSEYIIDPLGNYTRQSILTTEYKNLRLRFKDGVQISSTEFILPSERNGNVNLVKVEF